MMTTNKTQCTKCCSNLTLKCYVDAFVKVDAQIVTNFSTSNHPFFSCNENTCTW